MSYAPGQGIVLARNPNYRGTRPRHFARIDMTIGHAPHRAVAQVLAGKADYVVDLTIVGSDAATLDRLYGAGSPAARMGHQQYFVEPQAALDFFMLNAHRPLFADLRMRQAVNYAINRSAMAALGGGEGPLPERVADHYLPPGVPGFSDFHGYPSSPDLARARQLARGHRGATATLYTCDQPPCDPTARLLRSNLAAIGIRLQIKEMSAGSLFTRIIKRGEPFDITWFPWVADYLDPDNFLNMLMYSGTDLPAFADPRYRAPLAAAARLTGPARYAAYARLDEELTRNAAPWVAYGNSSAHELFASRIGCQRFGAYDVNLGALCLRSKGRG